MVIKMNNYFTNNGKVMTKKVLLGFSLLFSGSVSATQTTGTISAMSFFGSGDGEKMFITMEPKSSACPYAGAYVLSNVKQRAGLASALIAAFQSQSEVVATGTGSCDATWSNYEVLHYAAFNK